MNRIRLLFFLLLILPVNLFGQICKGRVVNAKTDEPLQYVNVFLHGSLIGTITDVEGRFELDCKGNTSLPLVVSCMGYQSVVVESDLYLNNLKILIEEKSYDIDEINVNGEPSAWSRRKMVKVFTDEFVGSTGIAKACEILNIDDIYLYYNKASKTLYAKCESPILIRNKNLGYNVSFLLEEFSWSKTYLKYKGFPSFKEHVFSGKREIKQIKKRRLLAYKGTLMDFSRCVQQGSLANSRFEIIDENSIELSLTDITDNEDYPSQLCSEGILTVYYGDKNVVSFLKFKEECIELNPNGYIDPDLILITGFMSVFRVGDMLPFDYIPEE